MWCDGAASNNGRTRVNLCFVFCQEVLSVELQQHADPGKLHLSFAFLSCLQETGRFSLNLTFLTKTQTELAKQVPPSAFSQPIELYFSSKINAQPIAFFNDVMQGIQCVTWTLRLERQQRPIYGFKNAGPTAKVRVVIVIDRTCHGLNNIKPPPPR